MLPHVKQVSHVKTDHLSSMYDRFDDDSEDEASRTAVQKALSMAQATHGRIPNKRKNKRANTTLSKEDSAQVKPLQQAKSSGSSAPTPVSIPFLLHQRNTCYFVKETSQVNKHQGLPLLRSMGSTNAQQSCFRMNPFRRQHARTAFPLVFT